MNTYYTSNNNNTIITILIVIMTKNCNNSNHIYNENNTNKYNSNDGNGNCNINNDNNIINISFASGLLFNVLINSPGTTTTSTSFAETESVFYLTHFICHYLLVQKRFLVALTWTKITGLRYLTTRW